MVPIINAEKMKCMFMSHEQNAGQNYNLKIDNKSFERVEQFKYLGTTKTNEVCVREEIRSRLKQGMLAIIWCRVFCLPVCYPKMYRLKYTEL